MLRMNGFCQNWLATHNTNTVALFVDQNIQCGVIRTESILSTYHYKENSFILSWLLEGKGAFETPENSYDLHSGCVCLRRPNRQYHLTFKENAVHHRCFLRLPPSLYAFLVSMFPEVDSLPSVIELDYSPFIHQRFLQLLDGYLTCHSDNLYWMLPETFSLIMDILAPSTPLDIRQLRQAQSLLERTKESPSLEDIAAACQMSYDKFRKTFQKVYGISPGQYRINHRIRIAKRMLMEGLSVGSVAAMLNYPDVYAFSHQFRSVTGCSPSAYVKFKQQPNPPVSSGSES